MIYTAKRTATIYVLHAFQKETQATTQRDITRAKTRFTDLIRDKPEHTKKVETCASVWDVIADTPEETANLRARAELMHKIEAILKASGWTQTEAAAKCGVTQPRINDLLRGRLSRFSLDALVNIATALGRQGPD